MNHTRTGALLLGAGVADAHGWMRERVPHLESYEQMPLPLEELAKTIRSQPAPA